MISTPTERVLTARYLRDAAMSLHDEVMNVAANYSGTDRGEVVSSIGQLEDLLLKLKEHYGVDDEELSHWRQDFREWRRTQLGVST